MAHLEAAAIQRPRMFAALQVPFGGLPGIGTNYVRRPPAIWNNAQERTSWLAEERTRSTDGQGFVDLKDFPDPLSRKIVDALTDHGDAAGIPFTSVAFPYSGYYALRDGWRWDSRYLWFMAARRGSGHAVENINSIAIAAFGRHLLVDSGPESYGNPVFLPEDQRQYERAIDRYADCTLSHNTVVVDGQSQRRLIYGENYPDRRPYKQPIATRWLHSADFDFVEGNYEDGYGNDASTDIHANHLRQIIFVRPAGLWIVLDRMNADAPHTYTQLWNFPPYVNHKGDANPGFRKDQIIVDSDQHKITTHDPDGPNVSLYQFNTEPLTYKTFYGSLDPFLGWYNLAIGGRRYPKLDVHTNWQSKGDSLLVTVIVPSQTAQSPVQSIISKNDAAKGIRGFDLVLGDGTHIALAAAIQPASLSVDQASASATVLLLVTRPNQPAAGLATDCSSLELLGKTVDPAVHDFVFHGAGDGPAAIRPMIRPTTFRWEPAGDSMAPRYH
jgi:hypothetical protein